MKWWVLKLAKIHNKYEWLFYILIIKWDLPTTDKGRNILTDRRQSNQILIVTWLDLTS